MEAGVFYGDTRSTKLSGESDTFADKEHPFPTLGEKKKKKNGLLRNLCALFPHSNIQLSPCLYDSYSEIPLQLFLLSIFTSPHLFRLSIISLLLSNKILSPVYPTASSEDTGFITSLPCLNPLHLRYIVQFP